MSATEAAPRAWRTVLERIERDLRDGVLGPGDRLPPERELAATLDVGRSSVREALRVLEVMGLIRTATGSGPQSGATVVGTPRGGLAMLLGLQVAAQSFPLADVVRTRLVLEEAVVGELATQEDRSIGHVHGILDEMDAAGLSSEEFLALDAELHLALADASGNTVIAAMMSGLRTAIESYVRDGAARLGNWDAMADTLRSEHRAIVAAIDAGDAAAARDRVHAHITGYYTATGLTAAHDSTAADAAPPSREETHG